MTSPDNDFKRSAIVACLHNDIFLMFSEPRFSMFNREIILEFCDLSIPSVISYSFITISFLPDGVPPSFLFSSSELCTMTTWIFFKKENNMIWFRDISAWAVYFVTWRFCFRLFLFWKKKFNALMKQGGSLLKALLFSLKLKNLMNIKFFRHNMCTNAIKVVT